MKILNSLAFDVYDIAEELLAKLKRDETVEKRKLNVDTVCDAIFYWIDNRYLQDRMRWCERPALSIVVWCQALNVDHTELEKNSIFHQTANYLDCQLNEILADLFPARTWRALFVRRINATSFILEVGEDYRIHYYMENIHKKPSKG